MGCLSVYPFGGVQPEGWVWLSHHQLHVGTGRKPLTTGGSPMVGSPDPCPFTSPTPLPLLDQMDGLCLSFTSGLFALGSQLYHAQKNQQRPGLTPNTRFTLSPHFPAGVQSPDFLHAPPPAQSSEGSLSGLAHSTRSPHPTWLLNLPRSAPGHDLQVEGERRSSQVRPRGLGVRVWAPGDQPPACQHCL